MRLQISQAKILVVSHIINSASFHFICCFSLREEYICLHHLDLNFVNIFQRTDRVKKMAPLSGYMLIVIGSFIC